MTELDKSIGFIGAGNMAEAIAGALIKSKSIEKSMISACDINIDRLGYMSTTYGINGTSDIDEVYNSADVIILAVKPQSMESVLKIIATCKKADDKRKLIISIAAGVTIKTFESFLYADADEAACSNIPIIRVMPNTPSLVLSGMSGICKNKHANSDDIQTAKTILSSMGKVIEVTESKMDAVTAISGSGPAYFFYFVESMVEEAENLGLTREEAITLTVTTMKGAADLLESSDDSPSVLRKKVTSPGGTTEAAIKVFDEAKTKEIIQKAVSAAAKRSRELS